MSGIEKKLKQSYQRLKELVKKMAQGNRQPQWVLQPVRVKRN